MNRNRSVAGPAVALAHAEDSMPDSPNPEGMIDEPSEGGTAGEANYEWC